MRVLEERTWNREKCMNDMKLSAYISRRRHWMHLAHLNHSFPIEQPPKVIVLFRQARKPKGLRFALTILESLPSREQAAGLRIIFATVVLL